MILNCIILDDEKLKNHSIEEHIIRTPFLYLEQKFKNVTRMLDYIIENTVGIIFINEDLIEQSHLEKITSLNKNSSIIFMSENKKIKIAREKMNIIDNLLQPENYSSFLKCSVKAVKQNYFMQERIFNTSNDNFLFVKSEYKIKRIELKSISYIEGMNEYVRIHRDNGKPIMSLLSLKAIEKQLPEDCFMRVHRSYIVNLRKISEIESNMIVLEEGKLIPVSKLFRERFQDYLNCNFV